MPNLKCLCGHTINPSPLPNPNGLVIISEARLDALITTLAPALAAPGTDIEATLHDRFPGRDASQGYECQACGRVAVFKRASDDVPVLWLRPEDPEAPRLASLGS